jgi:serine/threonine-protein kinase
MSLTAGDRLGPYEILGAIGAGAMGEVYRARDTDLNRHVAIKVLSAGRATSATALGRFEREAKLASSLNHPNIITIHSIGHTADEHPYIAMELVEGRTLADVLAEGPLSMRRATELAAQIASGLASAHKAGIVHRDLKPQNLMVRADGLVKIVDFGLSVLAPSIASEVETGEGHAPLTTAGAIMGTISYMSPEQASGRTVDFHSDQFSFGSVLYEMVTGQRAFRRPTSAQTMAAIIEDEPEPANQHNPDVPEAIEFVLERCLAKEPGDRFAATDDLARDLQVARDRIGGSRSVTRQTVPPQVVRSRRGTWLWGLAAASVLALALIAVPIARNRWFRAGVDPSGHQHLAVLPFTNIGNDPADQPFSDGLVEILTSQLTQVGQSSGLLDVVPASDVRTTRITSVEQARKLFRVSRVLTGSVQRTSNYVRVTVNLADADTTRSIDARTLNYEFQDTVKMQDDIVRQVSDLIGASLPKELAQALTVGGTAVPAAYESYTEARGHLGRYGQIGSVNQAISAFQRALEADPRYALAHAGLGEAYWRKYQLTSNASWAGDARASSTRAVELADRLAAVRLTLGVIDLGTGKVDDAVVELKKVIAIDPANADAYRELGNAYRALGKPAEAETSYQTAITMRPTVWANHNELAKFYLGLKRFDDAKAQFQTVIDLTPDSPQAYNNMGALYFNIRKPDLAEQMFRKSAEIQPNAEAYSFLGTVYFAQGRYAEAAQVDQQGADISEKDGERKSLIWNNLASALYWAPGQRAKAQPAFARALALTEEELQVKTGDLALLFRKADCQSRLGQTAAAGQTIAAITAKPLVPADMKRVGIIYEQMGNRTRALEWVQKALAGGVTRDSLNGSPDLAQLLTDPRFPKK